MPGIGNSWVSVSYPVTAGSHTFKWEYVKDGSASDGLDAAWIDNVVMPPLVHPPVIGADVISVTQGQSGTFTVASLLANDTDVDGDTIYMVGLGQPAHGTLVDNGNGSYTYTPIAGYSGADLFVQTIADGPVTDIYQWASSASASSEYDTSPLDWSSMQATGAPNVTTYGDNGFAWAPLSSGSQEWLQVGYDTYTYATGVTVYETFTNGYISQVELIDINDVAHVVWSGTDTTPANVVGEFVVDFAETTYQVKGVKISFLAAPDWIEIDAVQLRGRGQSGFIVQGNVSVAVLPTSDTTAPVVTAPADVTVSATGVLTPVILGVGSATDNVDGVLTASVDFTGPFLQGTHSITWRATDAAGNVGAATQTVTVQAAATSSLAVTAGATLPVGARQTLLATAIKADGSSEAVRFLATWSSSNTGVATVTNTGVVVAKAAGTATITASYDGLTASTVVTVTNPVLNSITLTPVSLSLKAGEYRVIRAAGSFSDGSTSDVRVPASWSSSNTGVATVTNWGKVTGVAAGSATITATWQGVNATATVTISPATLSSITVSTSNATPGAGQSLQLQASGLYSDGSTTNVRKLSTWSTSNTAIATVDSKGLLTTLSAGTVDVYATIGAVTGTLPLSVNAATLSSLQISPYSKVISEGDVEKFSATGLMSDGSKFAYRAQYVVWSSSDPLIASIDNQGFATGLSVGSVDIYASLSSGEQTWGSLTVNAATLTGLQIDKYTSSLPTGQQFVFAVTGTYSDGSSKRLKPKQVTWSSSDGGVVSISSGGLAAGQGVGTATVTATVGALSATTIVTVSDVTLSSLAMKPVRTTFPVGVAQRFFIDGTFSDASVLRLRPGDVTFSSSAPAVVSIDPRTGVATMLAAGTATITATYAATGLVTVSSTLTVDNVTLTSLLVRPNTTTMVAGDKLKYRAIGVFSDGSRFNVSRDAVWSSSSSAVATVDAVNGDVTAISAGTVTITATMPSGISGTLTITVN